MQALGLAGAALTALVMGVGNSADWWYATVFSIVVTVLAILVGATVVGAVVNRSWFGVPMLAMLLAVSAGLLITHPNLDGGFGDRELKPVTIIDAQHIERLGGGRLTIDLTALPSSEQSVTIDAEVGYGQIRPYVPADFELRLVTRVGAGYGRDRHRPNQHRRDWHRRDWHRRDRHRRDDPPDDHPRPRGRRRRDQHRARRLRPSPGPGSRAAEPVSRRVPAGPPAAGSSIR